MLMPKTKMEHNVNQALEVKSTEPQLSNLQEDPGKCRHELMFASLYNEQQKLRQVLHLANAVLLSGHNSEPENVTQCLQEVSPVQFSYKKTSLSCNSEVLLKDTGSTKAVYASVHPQESTFCSEAAAGDVRFQLPCSLSVYEQYKLCTEHLHQHKIRRYVVEPSREKVEEKCPRSVEKVKKVFIDEQQDRITSDTVPCCHGDVSKEEKPEQKQDGDGKVALRKSDEGTSKSRNKPSYLLTNGGSLQRPQSSQRFEDTSFLLDFKTSGLTVKQDPVALKLYSKTLSGDTENYKGKVQPFYYWYQSEPVNAWLSLPDELWLSILSLLPVPDLLSVAPVCRRLHALSADHSLWRSVHLVKCAPTDWGLLCLGRHRPLAVSLHNCRGQSVSSWGLRPFFYLCRHSLQEVKATGCTGAGLRGDLILALIGQLCSHVTSVDVSWSGATDAGLRALINCKRLRAVVLSGCHVTDQALLDLLLRLTTSLCKLEVFGCQSISSSCLEAIYEMCPNLQHLNIGQVRRVSTHSLTVLGSKLKNLRSLNVTGLQAVSDVVMEVVLQKCPLLHSLTLSQCPGVTDRTLHSISEFTPAIRSVDVSGCAAVTDAGVRSLARGCTRLQLLDLSSTATGDTGVALLAHHCRAHLHTVKLSFCRIRPHSLLQLCQRCSRLEVLHVYGCAQVPTGSQIRRVNPTVVIHPVPPDQHSDLFKLLDTRHSHKRRIALSHV